MIDRISRLLGDKAEDLLQHKCGTIGKDSLHLPGPDFVDRIFSQSDRNNRVLASLYRLYGHGRLGGTGYVSILPVDQGIEHSAGASFAPNPVYFDPRNIIELAIEGGCNGGDVDAGRHGHRVQNLRPQDPVFRKAESQ